MAAIADDGSWFDASNLLPVERLLFQSDVVTVGAFRCPPDSPFFRDSGPTHNYVVAFPRNAVRVRFAGKAPFVGTPNFVTVYNPGQEYTREPILPDLGDDSDWFALAPDVLLELLSDCGIRANGRRFFPFELSRCPAQVYARERVVIGSIEQQAADALEIEEAAVWMLRETFRAAGAGNVSANTRKRVEAAKEILSATLTEPLSMRDVAAEARTSVYHLCKIFRRVTGYRLQDYRRQLRLRESLQRVAEGEDLLQIAVDLGFCSHSHFTHSFRTVFGMSPSEFRSRLN